MASTLAPTVAARFVSRSAMRAPTQQLCYRSSTKHTPRFVAPGRLVQADTIGSSRRNVVAEAAAPTASTVNIIIQGRKLPVTDAIKSYVSDKIARAVENYQHTLKEVDVTLSARGGDTGTHGKKEQKVEVTIYTLRNGVVRVEDAETTLYAAIDLVCDKVERKLRKVKDKAIAKGKWPGRAGPHDRKQDEQEFQEYIKEVTYQTQVFDKEERLRRDFEELNKTYPQQVMRRKEVLLDPITVSEAIDALEQVGHDFYVFREMESDTIQVLYRRQEGGFGVLIPKRIV